MMDIEKLLQAPVFRNFPEKRLVEFLERTPKSMRKYPEKDFIALQNTPCQALYLLYSGRVRTYMTGPDGRQIAVEDLGTLALLAPAFLFAAENTFPVDIFTLTSCEVLVINKADFMHLMHCEPVVMGNFLQIISDRSILLSRKLSSFAVHDLKSRLAAYLCEHGTIKNQQEVADRLGVARPSLSRVLAGLAEEGAVLFEKRKIVVIDQNILRKYL